MENKDKEFLEIKKFRPLPKNHDDIKPLDEYWEGQLIEILDRNEQLLKKSNNEKWIIHIVPKPNIRERIRTWFLDRFADLYERVRGDFDE